MRPESPADKTLTRPAAQAPAAGHDAPTDPTGPSLAPPKPRSTPALRYPFLTPSANADELGSLAHYRVLRLLGEGGMGMVFKAEDTQLQRPVALKVMQPDRAQDNEARMRFLREARATAKLTHDHIVSIYQVGEAGGVPYIAMQYLRGMSLGSFLDRYKTPTPQQVLRVGKEVALGLAAAHKLGLIHRDIKPDNIWLEAPKGRVKLLDFGLARPSDVQTHLTQSGFIVGTPQYMSPEQARNLPLDGRSDLFSLGVVLYRLCTGCVPFHGDTLMATLTALAVDEPQPVYALQPEVPPALADLIHDLLAKNPADRPGTADEVAARLTHLERELRGQGVPSSDMQVPARRSWATGDIETSSPSPELPASAQLFSPHHAEPSSLTQLMPRKPMGKLPIFAALGIAAILLITTLLLVLHWSDDEPKSSEPRYAVPQQSLVGHLAYVRWVAVAPQGDVIASASFDRTARLWDALTGESRAELRGHSAGVEAVAFFPREPKFATASFDGTVKIWELSTGNCLRTIQVFPRPATVTGLGISPDGKFLACGGGAGSGQYDVYLLDADTGEKQGIFRGHQGHITCAEFSPDGRSLATCGVDSVVRIWEVSTQREQHILRGHQGEIEHASFSPDGKLIASASRDGSVRLWEMSNGREVRRFEGPQGFWAVRFAPRGDLLAAAGINGEIRLWHVPTGELCGVLAGHRGVVYHVAFTPDGQKLVSGGHDNTVKVWSITPFLRVPRR